MRTLFLLWLTLNSSSVFSAPTSFTPFSEPIKDERYFERCEEIYFREVDRAYQFDSITLNKKGHAYGALLKLLDKSIVARCRSAYHTLDQYNDCVTRSEELIRYLEESYIEDSLLTKVANFLKEVHSCHD